MFVIYGKYKNEKQFKPMNLQEGIQTGKIIMACVCG